MLKAELLRKFISTAVPYLRDNPDSLVVYTRKGRLVATGQLSSSFEYRYPLEVLVMDYPDSIDSLSVPILAWARKYQPDLLLNPDRRQNGITYEADLLSNSTMDILFIIQVDESTIVSRSDKGELIIKHRAEPMPSMECGPDGWELIADGFMVKGS
ncbi:phage tail protein [Limnobaculum xujianqingii]|uniref:phage tail protein n=1 Tax=Limnobaculum xujianqingii TaxID=2738837 RepID=UPI001129FB50|nr:phage tail protein [Limnobaculum xujianqingii]